MGNTARDNYRRRHGRKTHGPAFVQLYYYLLDSEAWHQLTFTARAAYIEMARLYNGVNNGTLAMGARRLAKQLPCTPNTAARALHELDNAGFIEPTKFGSFGRKGKERHATEYRLTCYRCDVTGELPSKRFNPKKRHAATYQNLRQHVSVFDTEAPQDEQTVSKTNTFEANFGPANVPNIDTHIDIYHKGSGEGGAADPSSLPSSLLPSLVGSNSRATVADPPWSVEPASSAWEECYRLARASEGDLGAALVDQARQIGGATAEDVLDAIHASNETGKPLDFELASFLG
jgi:hypothetical protein